MFKKLLSYKKNHTKSKVNNCYVIKRKKKHFINSQDLKLKMSCIKVNVVKKTKKTKKKKKQRKTTAINKKKKKKNPTRHLMHICKNVT